MTMEPIDMAKTKAIAKRFGLTPIKIKGTTQIQIAKNTNESKYEIITWEEFERILDEKNLIVCKAYESCFLEMMKKKPN